MCATCGCSNSRMVTITDMGSGQHFHLHDPPDRHNHAHSHSHSHDHPHEHGDGLHHHHHEQDHASANARRIIRVEEDLLANNNRLAERNRGWFLGRNILALNLLSAPGAGKTTLLERTIRELHHEFSFHVIEGDQATTHDAERIRKAGCSAIQVNTGAGCHLDAAMIQAALGKLNPPPGSTVLIENVGNLVCPALFDLGEQARVVVVSVTEGEDKPVKYPHMFRSADLIVLNKVDLLPHVSFRVERFKEFLAQVGAKATIIETSATSGEGLSTWYEFLRELRRGHTA